MMGFVAWIPVVGQIVDLGFYIADKVHERRAAREAKRKALAKKAKKPC